MLTSPTRALLRTLLGVVGMCAALHSAGSHAQTGPVTVVVGYPTGGTGSIVGEPLVNRLAQILGQKVELAYEPGASGAVAAKRVAQASPDGQTILLGQTGELVINPHLVRDLGYDPDQDFLPVAVVALVPLALVVKADARLNTLDDLVAAARSSRKGLSFASGGPGTTAQFAGELLRVRSGTRLVHVPSDGAAAALRSVIDGGTDFYFAPLATALPAIKDGSVRAIAQSFSNRSLALPTVPTMEEAGYGDFKLSAWVVLLVPRRTPEPIVERLNAAVNQALGEPALREHLIASGVDLMPMSTNGTKKFLDGEYVAYRDAINEQFCSRFGYGGCLGFNVFE